MLAAPKEHVCRLQSQGLWGEVISFMRPTIRVGGQYTEANKPSFRSETEVANAVKACWEDMVWDEIITLSIRQYERKGPSSKRPQHGEPGRGLSLPWDSNERNTERWTGVKSMQEGKGNYKMS